MLRKPKLKLGRPYGLRAGVTSIQDVLSVKELLQRMKNEFIAAIEEQQNNLARFR